MRQTGSGPQVRGSPTDGSPSNDGDGEQFVTAFRGPNTDGSMAVAAALVAGFLAATLVVSYPLVAAGLAAGFGGGYAATAVRDRRTALTDAVASTDATPEV
jgi:hypothetical protein